MIDEATGADRKFIEAFILWVNVNIWGPVDGSPATEDAVSDQAEGSDSTIRAKGLADD